MNSSTIVVRRGGTATALALALVAMLVVLMPTPSRAETDPTPGDPAESETVSANPLPTAQIGTGVVWTQKVVGNTVYVGGEFSTARPAGAAPGTQTVPRSNLLAYDIRTGQLINSWAPSANGMVNSITAPPDGSRIYVGGTFTTINGVTQRRIAALNPTTGALITSFNPNPDGQVRSISATNTTVYFGGNFTVAGDQTRSRLAAARASDGAVLPWAPTTNQSVRAVLVSPDATKVLVGGQFTTLNGSSNPGYGLGAVDAITGALLPWAANSIVRNGGDDGAINFLTTDGEDAYASGFTFGRAGGTLEGIARMSWSGGEVRWIDDCHGDTYSVAPIGDAVYSVGHPHFCGNVPGGFHQSNPWKFFRGTAFSKKATGTLGTEYYGYTNWAGNPAPSILQWFPDLRAGTYTGQTQAAWNLNGNADYVVAGGEFERVGSLQQQGLVRFAKRSVAGNPNSNGGEINGSNTNPTVTSPGAGQALVCWQANWDRDNERMTYRVIRDNVIASPIHTRTVGSVEWDRPYQCYLDTGQTPGASVTYRIFATDPIGNEDRSDQVAVTIAGSGAADTYARSVTSDGPMHYWRFSEGSGSGIADYTGNENASAVGNPTRGVAGAITGDNAITFNGTTSQTAANAVAAPGPFWFSVEAWFRTSTTNGGKIIGFGNQQFTTSSSLSDRHLYMDSIGRIGFGTRMGSFRTLQSQSGLNNNQWHQAVGVVGPSGMSLYVDGRRVGYRSDATGAQPYDGYWRIGGDNTSSGWPGSTPSDYFNGSIDEVAVYNHALMGNDVRDHFLASGRTIAGPAAPADSYGSAVYDDGPDGYWRLAETSGSSAADSSLNGYTAGYLDNGGGAGPTKGGASAIGLGSDGSASFDGSGDFVAANTSTASPSRYSAEVWFRTGTNNGGKLIGFGNARTGNSSTYDRHVFMTNSGRLRFGARALGVQYVIESPNTYNDNTWHHVVAEQGTAGMKLFVDGVQVASNTQSTVQSYNGYWRIGGDSLSGWDARPNSDYFAGSLDEAAVYPRALSAVEVLDHFARGGGQVANEPPVAAFTFAVDDLSVSFDSSGSADVDGTIVSRSWTFGDGGTSTQANPTHVYTAGGTYTVELTVTDDGGDTDSVTHQVSPVEPAPNQLPVAAFSSSVTDLTVAFDSSASDDPDGTISSYAWDFGDSATSTLANPTHAYAAGGIYTVKLTVTDNDGGSASVSHSVTVTPPVIPDELIRDTFARTVTDAWGTAEVGGAWTTTGSANRFSVAGGAGRINLNAAGVGPWVYLNGVSAADIDGTIDLSIDKPATGGGVFHAVATRRSGTSEYRFTVKQVNGGAVELRIGRVESGVETRLGAIVTVSGLTAGAGDVLRLEFSVEGSGTTTLTAKIWMVGDPEPAAVQITRTDSTAVLQDAGSFGIQAYLSGSATNAPVLASYDNLAVLPR